MVMPPSSPYPIIVTTDARAAPARAGSHRPTTAYRLVVRARIVLAAAAGGSNAAIAAHRRALTGRPSEMSLFRTNRSNACLRPGAVPHS
jgi:hypothetical protein